MSRSSKQGPGQIPTTKMIFTASGEVRYSLSQSVDLHNPCPFQHSFDLFLHLDSEDFTPSRSSTPDHPRLITSFSGRMPADRPKPSLIRKKQRLLELLQEKQHYDDDDDSINDGGSDLENGDGAVHAEEYMKASRKGKKSQKSSRSGCFPSLIWKHSFTSRRKERKEHNKDKVNQYHDVEIL